MGDSDCQRAIRDETYVAVIGIWVDGTRYQVVDTITGRSEVVTIMGTTEEMKDTVYMQELECLARETVVRDWRAAQRRMPHTKAQRQELGHIMREIKESRDFSRENLHGRYW